jgi:hypothetical protein
MKISNLSDLVKKLTEVEEELSKLIIYTKYLKKLNPKK